MEQPPGYVAHKENAVCRFRNAIYGLKQSSRAWFENFSLVISGISFARCHSDYLVFVRCTKSFSVILSVYVDILLNGSDSVALAETKEYLKRHFVMKDMSQNIFLGLELPIKNISYFLSLR